MAGRKEEHIHVFQKRRKPRTKMQLLLQESRDIDDLKKK